MMKKWISFVMVTMLMVISLPVYSERTAAANALKFKDVPSTHWAYASIIQAAEKGYVKGFPDGTFRPNDSVTAAQFISMLILSLTEKDESGIVNWSKDTLDRIPDYLKFQIIYGVQFDFSQGSPWYINYVNIAKDFSVINNEYEGRYNEPLTRERAASIVNGMVELLDGVITDSYSKLVVSLVKDNTKMDENFRVPVGATMIRGIMTGFPDNTWRPKKLVTRSEAIELIERVSNKTIRNPVETNMTGIPYSDVPVFGFSNSMRIVFTNAEMKKVYDTLSNTQEVFQGSYLNETGSLWYYKDEIEKEKAIRKLFYFEDFTDPEQYYDLGINLSENVYSLSINGKPGSLDRASKPLDELLSFIFNSTDAATVRKLINGNISGADRKIDINKTLGKREVYNSSSGRNILHIAVSAYPDKK
jgi:hypothetical protein